MKFAPIALFTYARPEHTRRTVQALLANANAVNHDLIVFSDGPQSAGQQHKVSEVRAYLTKITGFRSVTIYERDKNLGLSRSIIDGVGQVLSKYDRIIVLEDDIVTSPNFLSYMNNALDKYEKDERVISIHGYIYPVKLLPETFFLRGADCWGWATWKRGWNLFNSDGEVLLNQLRRSGLIDLFDYNGGYQFSEMLNEQVKGLNDSWAIRWYASAFLANKLTLYPGRSLVCNIGNDGSGVHCPENSIFDIELSSEPIELNDIDIVESVAGREILEQFFKKNKPSLTIKIKIFLKKRLLNLINKI